MSRAGTTGGVPVIAEVGAWGVGAGSAGGAGCVVPGALPVGGLGAGAVAPPLAARAAGREPPPSAPIVRSSPDFFARTAGVRIPSSSCVSASRNRDASQRMM
jgi:hypothetical protein